MIGARLRQARLAMGMSLEELASRLSRPLTKQALSKYETNKVEAAASTLMDIAQVLGVKPSYLLSESRVAVAWVGYRKHSALGVREQESISATATKRLENELELRTLFGVGLNHSLPRGIVTDNVEAAESAARKVRSDWGLGAFPINGLIETIEDHGGVVLSWDEDRTFDGLSGWTDEGHPVIVINSAKPADRRRFDAAHELGHLVMSVAENTDYERLAHRFAAAFLVPRESALKELGSRRRNLSVDELGLLKERWGLSMQGWIMRAHDLGVIDDAHYRSINIVFRRRSWHRMEPYQYEGIEKPLLLRRLVWRALTEGLITHRDAKEVFSTDEFEEPGTELSGPSLRQIARLPREERHRVISAATWEVDEAEVELWDTGTIGSLESEDEP